jgi:hypothetical protein
MLFSRRRKPILSAKGGSTTIQSMKVSRSLAKFYPLALFAVLTVIFYEGHSPFAMSSSSTVWVMQSDGGKSCESNSGNSLEQGAASLRKMQIKVLNSHKGNDGKMHAQMCGLPSGTANVYQINRSDLTKASALGFVEAPKE